MRKKSVTKRSLLALRILMYHFKHGLTGDFMSLDRKMFFMIIFFLVVRPIDDLKATPIGREKK